MSEQQSLFGRKLHADLEIEDELRAVAIDVQSSIVQA
jgi:hypothetical protein